MDGSERQNATSDSRRIVIMLHKETLAGLNVKYSDKTESPSVSPKPYEVAVYFRLASCDRCNVTVVVRLVGGVY
jgi:hypothetical protein